MSLFRLFSPWIVAVALATGGAGVLQAAPVEQEYADAMDRGSEAFQRGQFEVAVGHFERADALARGAGDPSARLQALLRLAEAYQELGQHRRSLQYLTTAKALAEQGDRSRLAAAVENSLGNAYFLSGNLDFAERHYQAAVDIARQLGEPDLLGATLNSLGNFYSASRQDDQALAAYRESIANARRAGATNLVVKAQLNAARVALATPDAALATEFLTAASDQIDGLPAPRERALNLIALGQLSRQLAATPGADRRSTGLAFEALSTAAEIAEDLGDQRTLAYAWGYLGRLYEDQRRYDDALILTRRAVFAAQQNNAPESLYLWEWQTGRLLRARGEFEPALKAYRRAVTTLQSIRPELSAGYLHSQLTGFSNADAPFIELADLLLRRAAASSDDQTRETFLREARETVEIFRAAELTDYFRDDCVVALESRITAIDAIDHPKTAIIYHITHPDRVELLVSLPAEGPAPKVIRQVSADLPRAELERLADQFRRSLVRPDLDVHFELGRQLYEALMRPLEPSLAERTIDTLVFVPDATLRTIPMAALHDGDDYLIRDYAIAVTPGLNLTDLRPFDSDDVELLVGGLTEAVQEFPALPSVAEEVAAIQTLFPGSQILKDTDYQLETFQSQLTQRPYSVVHIASHAQFTGDIDSTFLLTYDDKLTMDRLEAILNVSQYRQRPVELLVLSACQTATGDERASLGLAGVAVKSGARSALASLWSVADETTAQLMDRCYRELRGDPRSKALALRNAQLALLDGDNLLHRHPFFWSPFLMIGNWL
ncbi:MAG: CHAT domain-containing protein [Candidatus Competibacterales bacterium]